MGGSSTRERILDEAERLIARKGLDELRLRDVADAIGIRVPSIYGHFESRDAVRYGVVERYVIGMSEQFPYDGDGEPTKVLLEGISEFVRYLVERPAFTRLELRDLESPSGLWELNQATEGTMLENLQSGPMKDLYARVSALLEDGRARGEFRRVGLIPFWRALLGASLAALTWPTQSCLLGAASDAEIDHLIQDVQDVVLRFVRAD